MLMDMKNKTLQQSRLTHSMGQTKMGILPSPRDLEYPSSCSALPEICSHPVVS